MADNYALFKKATVDATNIIAMIIKELSFMRNDIKPRELIGEIDKTLFFRISQTFENHLSKERWHSDLLRKMTIDVKGVRTKVIRDETGILLDEFLKFRHFRRYYFSMEYDWDKLQYLEKKYIESEQNLLSDLKIFREFITSILSD